MIEHFLIALFRAIYVVTENVLKYNIDKQLIYRCLKV